MVKFAPYTRREMRGKLSILRDYRLYAKTAPLNKE